MLILMLIGVIVAVSLLLNRFNSRSTATRNQETMQTLALAKEALIGWSAARATTPGMFPCPENPLLIGDPDSEGSAQIGCGNLIQVGRLPWRTLGLPQLRDDAGEPLWYALSPGFRTPPPINGNTPAQLTVDGVANSAVAIIFSPGAPLAGQNRPLPTALSPPVVAQYLDGSNNSGTGLFITTGSPDLFNDRMVIITHRDLFNAVNRRILSEIRGDALEGLEEYYADNGNTYPWAAADSAGVPVAMQLTPVLPHSVLDINATVNANNWYALVTYSVNATRQQVILTINTPSPVSCTITPGQMQCPNP